MKTHMNVVLNSVSIDINSKNFTEYISKLDLLNYFNSITLHNDNTNVSMNISLYNDEREDKCIRFHLYDDENEHTKKVFKVILTSYDDREVLLLDRNSFFLSLKRYMNTNLTDIQVIQYVDLYYDINFMTSLINHK